MRVGGNGVSYLKWCGLSNSTPEVALDWQVRVWRGVPVFRGRGAYSSRYTWQEFNLSLRPMCWMDKKDCILFYQLWCLAASKVHNWYWEFYLQKKSREHWNNRDVHLEKKYGKDLKRSFELSGFWQRRSLIKIELLVEFGDGIKILLRVSQHRTNSVLLPITMLWWWEGWGGSWWSGWWWQQLLHWLWWCK